MASQWECGVCGESFCERNLVTLHLRSEHSLTGVPFAQLEATTWSRDTHGLFDTEGVDKHQHQRLVVPVLSEPVRLCRDGSDKVKVSLGRHRLPSGTTSLHAQLKQSMSRPMIETSPSNHGRPSRAMWQRVSTEGCQLKVGDVFKVGRYTVVVSQVCLAGEPQVPKLQALEDADDPVSVSACLCMPASACEQNQTQSESGPSCRICLESALEADSDSDSGIQL